MKSVSNAKEVFGMRVLVVVMLLLGTAGAYTEHTYVYHADSVCTLKATLCTPDTGSAHPCIVLIHEGGFSRGSRFSFAQYGDYFTARGYATAALDYRLMDEGGRYPAPIRDCIEAVRWLTAQADSMRIDPHKLILLGSSAGAYLATMTSLAPLLPGSLAQGHGAYPLVAPRILGVISSFGLYDWTSCSWRGEGFLPAGAAEIASPRTYAAGALTSYLLLAGERDRLFGFAQAQVFAQEVRSADGDAKVYIMPAAMHQGISNLNDPLMQWALPKIEHFIAKRCTEAPPHK